MNLVPNVLELAAQSDRHCDTFLPKGFIGHSAKHNVMGSAFTRNRMQRVPQRRETGIGDLKEGSDRDVDRGRIVVCEEAKICS